MNTKTMKKRRTKFFEATTRLNEEEHQHMKPRLRIKGWSSLE
jgi:hypothetical protein